MILDDYLTQYEPIGRCHRLRHIVNNNTASPPATAREAAKTLLELAKTLHNYPAYAEAHVYLKADNHESLEDPTVFKEACGEFVRAQKEIFLKEQAECLDSKVQGIIVPFQQRYAAFLVSIGEAKEALSTLNDSLEIQDPHVQDRPTINPAEIYVIAAEPGLPAAAVASPVQLKLIRGVQYLSAGRFKNALTELSSIDANNFATEFPKPQAATISDVATWTGLCLLADDQSIPDSRITDLLDHNPVVRNMVMDFEQNNFGRCLSSLADFFPNLSLDPFLAPVLSEIIDNVRQKALPQIAIPFTSFALKFLASTLHCSDEDAKRGVITAIKAGRLRAKLDSVNGVVYKDGYGYSRTSIAKHEEFVHHLLERFSNKRLASQVSELRHEISMEANRKRGGHRAVEFHLD